MKKSSLIKSIAFILWFVIFCSMKFSAATDKNVISTIKKVSADFTYRILPADVKLLYVIEAEDVEIKMEIFAKPTDKIIAVTPTRKINHVRHDL
jgi:hypothetical protein